MTETYSLKALQLRFNVPQHVLIHLCEKGVIIPEIADPQGRGKSRLFSKKNVLEFAFALELRKYEIPISRAGAIVRILEAFEKSIKKNISNFTLSDSLQKNSPSLVFYLFNGEEVVFEFGMSSLVSFNLMRLMAGEVKRAQVEPLKKLPADYTSYLKIDLKKLAVSME